MPSYLVLDGSRSAVATAIKVFRRHAGYTQNDLAEFSGYSRSCISLIERQQHNIYHRTLVDLAETCGWKLVCCAENQKIPLDLSGIVNMGRLQCSIKKMTLIRWAALAGFNVRTLEDWKINPAMNCQFRMLVSAISVFDWHFQAELISS